MADNPDTGDKYIALFYSLDQKPVQEDIALYNSRLITHEPGEQAAEIQVNIEGAKKLYLVVTDGGNGNHWDHADWIEPKLTGKKGLIHLTEMKWINATSGWETVKINKSVAGNKLIVDGKEYENGIGTHATSIIEYELPEGYETFSSIVGLDRECVAHTEGATVKFHVFNRYPTGSPPVDSVDVQIRLEQLGIKGTCKVRDLWAKKDIGEFTNEISVSVRKHGTRLLKISEFK
jgi:alpha-galactosidase